MTSRYLLLTYFAGVTSDAECSELPSNLQAGCHWRWQWYVLCAGLLRFHLHSFKL